MSTLLASPRLAFLKRDSYMTRLVIVQNSMILMGIPTFWQGFALGLLIIVGTGVSALQVMRARRNTH